MHKCTSYYDPLVYNTVPWINWLRTDRLTYFKKFTGSSIYQCKATTTHNSCFRKNNVIQSFFLIFLNVKHGLKDHLVMKYNCVEKWITMEFFPFTPQFNLNVYTQNVDICFFASSAHNSIYTRPFC